MKNPILLCFLLFVTVVSAQTIHKPGMVCMSKNIDPMKINMIELTNVQIKDSSLYSNLHITFESEKLISTPQEVTVRITKDFDIDLTAELEISSGYKFTYKTTAPGILPRGDYRIAIKSQWVSYSWVVTL